MNGKSQNVYLLTEIWLWGYTIRVLWSQWVISATYDSDWCEIVYLWLAVWRVRVRLWVRVLSRCWCREWNQQMSRSLLTAGRYIWGQTYKTSLMGLLAAPCTNLSTVCWQDCCVVRDAAWGLFCDQTGGGSRLWGHVTLLLCSDCSTDEHVTSLLFVNVFMFFIELTPFGESGLSMLELFSCLTQSIISSDGFVLNTR